MPDGASRFVSACSSTISACGRYRAASRAKRIISTAPTAKFGAWKTATPASRAGASAASTSQPVVPTTDGTPRSIAARTFGNAASGAVKSTTASASSSSTSVCPSRSSAGPSTRPTLPVRPLRQTLTLLAALRSRPAEPGFANG